jgi:hypothetical protein
MQEEAPEGSTNYVVVGCAAGGTIINVTFASFGTPVGNCSTGFATGACASNTSLLVVEATCLGRQGCAIPVTDAEFGDPCEGTKKALAVQVACSHSPPPPLPPVALNVTVPVGAVALVAIPLLRAGPDVTLNVTESGTLVWTAGAFVPGSAPGVLSGEWLAAPIPAVGFHVVGGGSYAFVAQAEAAMGVAA